MNDQQFLILLIAGASIVMCLTLSAAYKLMNMNDNRKAPKWAAGKER